MGWSCCLATRRGGEIAGPRCWLGKGRVLWMTRTVGVASPAGKAGPPSLFRDSSRSVALGLVGVGVFPLGRGGWGDSFAPRLLGDVVSEGSGVSPAGTRPASIVFAGDARGCAVFSGEPA